MASRDLGIVIGMARTGAKRVVKAASAASRLGQSRTFSQKALRDARATPYGTKKPTSQSSNAPQPATSLKHFKYER